ncbi:predicted protein [Postia placenta Mad-698-R]|uniref:Uncharacterized protein n=1 Tax=Postia placenta MAD-698-R-SB12 TaxID=670580 RepID=A0A1X6MN46_9APHY|nr:hypothetical protein POSPLADRAFT_1155921 [Postia placenta MAD-698-R-SB12]EED83281.1 predicted protein [Postia placenta Mad-698-R]OSX57612.1 hypothetical protein POSPLADRAFT_1155921 [Postia placenta MAD-698-R-SB12]
MPPCLPARRLALACRIAGHLPFAARSPERLPRRPVLLPAACCLPSAAFDVSVPPSPPQAASHDTSPTWHLHWSVSATGAVPDARRPSRAINARSVLTDSALEIHAPMSPRPPPKRAELTLVRHSTLLLLLQSVGWRPDFRTLDIAGICTF